MPMSREELTKIAALAKCYELNESEESSHRLSRKIGMVQRHLNAMKTC